MKTKYPMTHKVKSLTGSRKREFSLNPTDHVQNVDSYWDGGSKDFYHVVNIDTGLNVAPEGNHPFGDHGKVGYKLISGDILIRTGTFCGKPSTPCLLCRAEDENRVRQYLGLPVVNDKVQRATVSEVR